MTIAVAGHEAENKFFGKACGIRSKELAKMYCIDVSNIYKLLKGVSFGYI